MERDARDRFDRTGMTSAHEPDQPVDPAEPGEQSEQADDSGNADLPEPGTDPAVVGDRDEPDLPVRTSAAEAEDAGELP